MKYLKLFCNLRQIFEVDLPAKGLLNKAFGSIFLKGLVGHKIPLPPPFHLLDGGVSLCIVAKTTCNLKYIDVSLGAFEEVH